MVGLLDEVTEIWLLKTGAVFTKTIAGLGYISHWSQLKQFRSEIFVTLVALVARLIIRF